MPRKSSIAYVLAAVYAASVSIAVAWAWFTDLRLLHSPREYLLPDICLALVTLPASQALSLLYRQWPAFFTAPMMQLCLLTICGLSQVAIVFSFLRFFARAHHEA
jgi:hypothetical protein